MTIDGAGHAEHGGGAFARYFIPESHRSLPMLRLYLPFRDDSPEPGEDVVRWSRHVDVEDLPASVDWFEATADAAEADPAIRELASCMGELDPLTAAALSEATAGLRMRCLRWVGYGEATPSPSSVRVFGEEYVEAELHPEDLRPGRRVPEFVWDADGRLAWGGRLYPDSLIVAAEVPIFRSLRNDPRIDTASVRADRDVLPRSAGD